MKFLFLRTDLPFQHHLWYSVVVSIGIKMCGIFGYIGDKKSPSKVCLTGLKALEYRGYDSAGIAGISNGKIICRKEVGKLEVLENSLKHAPIELSLAIGHTRWATHGVPSQVNSHPHLDMTGSIAVVHNGIIENFAPIKKKLEALGIKFVTDTDTEVIANLIAHHYEGDLRIATTKALEQMEGFWGLAIIHKDHPGEIIAAARENPIAIGRCPLSNESYISSDPNAFNSKKLDVMFLNNDEIAVIHADKVQVYDNSSSLIEKETKRLKTLQQIVSKNGYDHFMLKEIHDQSKTIRLALHGRILEEFETAIFDELVISKQDLIDVSRIVIVACGTSWHAGLIAATMLEEMARIPTTAEIASEFRYKNPIIDSHTLVIAISQSGETLDTLAALREVKSKGAKVIAICNVPNSTLSREADSTLFLRAGPEISVCSTKAFTSQLTVLSLFSLFMARLRHMGKEEGKQFIEGLKKLPSIVQKVLAMSDEIEAVATKYAHYTDFFFLGRNYMHTTALENALKLKEISYVNATGYPAGEMKHGPIALICETLPIIGLCGNKRTADKMMSNLMEMKSRKSPILAFAPISMEEIVSVADDVVYLPEVPDYFASIPYAIAGQLFAYFIAKIRKTDIDQPRNLAKSVTVE